jgi:hypothetical protein
LFRQKNIEFAWYKYVCRNRLAWMLRKWSISSTTVCHLLKVVPRYSWIRVSKWGAHKCVGISSMLSVSEVCKI